MLTAFTWRKHPQCKMVKDLYQLSSNYNIRCEIRMKVYQSLLSGFIYLMLVVIPICWNLFWNYIAITFNGETSPRD